MINSANLYGFRAPTYNPEMTTHIEGRVCPNSLREDPGSWGTEVPLPPKALKQAQRVYLTQDVPGGAPATLSLTDSEETTPRSATEPSGTDGYVCQGWEHSSQDATQIGSAWGGGGEGGVHTWQITTVRHGW